MNATTTPRAELLALIQMTEEAIEFCKADGEDYSRQAEVLDKYRGQLAALGDSDGGVIRVDATEERGLLTRPEGGKAHRNQYGPCQVAYATDKQQAFALSLLDRKDTSGLATGPLPIDTVELRERLVARKINKRAISDVIERLLACPDLAGFAAASGHPASEKQLAFIARLASEKSLTDEERAKVREAVSTKSLSTKGASATIEKLMALPTAPKAERKEIEAGVYTDGTTTFRVYLGQTSGRMLAAKVVQDGAEFSFDYAGAADRFVTASFRKMTIEEAARFGQLTGTCIVCARRLDVPESVDRGIGPVCFAKMGG